MHGLRAFFILFVDTVVFLNKIVVGEENARTPATKS